MVSVLSAISREHRITVSATTSDHDRLTTGGSVSNHFYGRAVDIATVDGQPVEPRQRGRPRAGDRAVQPGPEHPAERDRLAVGAPGRGLLHRRRPPEPHPRRRSTTRSPRAGGRRRSRADPEPRRSPTVPASRDAATAATATTARRRRQQRRRRRATGGARGPRRRHRGRGRRRRATATTADDGTTRVADDPSDERGGRRGRAAKATSDRRGTTATDDDDSDGTAGDSGDDAATGDSGGERRTSTWATSRRAIRATTRPRQEIAAWMGERGAEARAAARAAGDGRRWWSPACSNLDYGDADSVGFFQMRVGIWNQGDYAGYPDKPELQLKWFLDHAVAVKKQRIAGGSGRRPRQLRRVDRRRRAPGRAVPRALPAAPRRGARPAQGGAGSRQRRRRRAEQLEPWRRRRAGRGPARAGGRRRGQEVPRDAVSAGAAPRRRPASTARASCSGPTRRPASRSRAPPSSRSWPRTARRWTAGT